MQNRPTGIQWLVSRFLKDGPDSRKFDHGRGLKVTTEINPVCSYTLTKRVFLVTDTCVYAVHVSFTSLNFLLRDSWACVTLIILVWLECKFYGDFPPWRIMYVTARSVEYQLHYILVSCKGLDHGLDTSANVAASCLSWNVNSVKLKGTSQSQVRLHVRKCFSSFCYSNRCME